MSKLVVVMTTTESATEAARIAKAMIEKRLAACVQIVGPLQSVYRWQGAIESAAEYRCEIKTRADQLATIQELVHELHSYEVPELIVLPILEASPSYSNWLEEQLGDT